MSTDAHDKVTVTLPGLEPVASVPGSQSRTEDWRSVLLSLIASTPGGISGVAKLAEEMGIEGLGRVYITRVLSTGKSRIEQPSRHFIERVWKVAGRYCPHLCRDISVADCQAHRQKTYAQAGVARMVPLTTVDHWRACRKCANNPNAEPAKADKGARHA